MGATDWCTHPAGLEVARVRGTKNPDRQAIRALSPDLVIANKEENRRHRRRTAARATASTSGSPTSSRWNKRSPHWPGCSRSPWTQGFRRGWRDAQSAWSQPIGQTGRRAVVAVWRDPWMVVGSRTFAGDVLRRLGLVNVFADHPDRYPHIDARRDPRTAPRRGRPAGRALPVQPGRRSRVLRPGQSVLVPGRLLTWYGPSLAEARTTLGNLLNRSEVEDQPRGDRT